MSSEAQWKATTIETILPSVVVLKYCHTQPFDIRGPGTFQATGFVCDREKGLILTNAHVAGPGPFWGTGTFYSKERIPVYPLCNKREPTHDFAFLRFDPKALKHMCVSHLPLRPDLAKVGEEIRLVGNDAGEELSIQPGVISRVDRNAPEINGGYSDFNTNYIQASVGTVGGSSGSPVVNIDGHAVAMIASGRSDKASIDFFIPLDRPLRALKCIQDGSAITRGTIQCQWVLKPYDECQKLGLTLAWESAYRATFPDERQMLVAERVLPQGPSDTKVEVGDVLIKAEGEMLAQFAPLENILDTHVNTHIRFLLQRNGKDIEVEVLVEDLYKITPDRYLTAAGATFNNLSYHQARKYGIACNRVFVSDPSGYFEPLGSGCTLETVRFQNVRNIDELADVLKSIPEGENFVVTYRKLEDPNLLRRATLFTSRRWYKMRQVAWKDETGFWDSTEIKDSIEDVQKVYSKVTFEALKHLPHHVKAINQCIVTVSCSSPIFLNGETYSPPSSSGFVIDADRGLVFVSAVTVPNSLGDIFVTIGESVTIRGEYVWQHLWHGYTIIKYNPSDVDARLQSINLSSQKVTSGLSTDFLGLSCEKKIRFASTTINEVATLELHADFTCPKYRAINNDVIMVETNLGGTCPSGILVGDDGKVQAMWMRYLTTRSSNNNNEIYKYLGLPATSILSVVEELRKGEVPNFHILGVEFHAITIQEARAMRVSESWIMNVTGGGGPHRLFVVKRALSCDDEFASLMRGDIILTLNDHLITSFPDLEVMYSSATIQARIIRSGEELTMQLSTTPADNFENRRAVCFCGATLQPPSFGVRLQARPHSEVYVSHTKRGSPAHHDGLRRGKYITRLNNLPITDLDSLLHAEKSIGADGWFTLRITGLDGIDKNITMRTNYSDFPTTEFAKHLEGWKQTEHNSGGEAGGAM